MATVYKAYEEPLTRHVAIKVLPEFFAEDKDYRLRFQVEAVAVAKLRHNNILTVFAYGEEGGVPCIVCEFMDGGTLAERLDGAMPIEDAVSLLTPVASALDYANSRGVLHRDIKPSNIMLLSDGTPVLTDFGLAKVVGGETITVTGQVLGLRSTWPLSSSLAMAPAQPPIAIRWRSLPIRCLPAASRSRAIRRAQPSWPR